MSEKICVRRARRDEMEWVNGCYDAVEFVHSNYDHEIIAVAEMGDQKAGLGRLVSVDDAHLELGGMYVFDSFRKKGVAGEIVKFLLQHVSGVQTVYCIPFQHLVGFYSQYGFRPVKNFDGVPKEIHKKYRWCQEKYPQPTELLVLESRLKDHA